MTLPGVAGGAVPSKDTFAAEVRHFLTSKPRQLPSRALYDALGSLLFETICELPWYPITRAERRLLTTYRNQIFREAGWPDRLVELGCGNGEKLALLLGPNDSAHPARGLKRIDLIDVSGAALGNASRLIHDLQHVTPVTHQAEYEAGLMEVARSRSGSDRMVVLFLGSNIGNFDPGAAAQFVESIRALLRPDDVLLIGADLVKPEQDLLLAYDDPLGVTAAFNKNLLLRLNRELGANFDLQHFDHRAVWNADASRIEMHLVSREQQRVKVPNAFIAIDLAAGEMIWTESSYKYQPEHFERMLRAAQFDAAQRWIDREGQFLLVAARAS